MTRYAMIMAGGAGTRLWPMSRRDRPKQLLPLFNGRSLLQIAVERIAPLIDATNLLICTADRFRAQAISAVPSLREDQILGEPEGRDTVNAIGLTAVVLARRDPGALFAVLTADHLITPEDLFRHTIDEGFRLVEASPDRLVTFSIAPTSPATAYGYVERGEAMRGFQEAFRVARFVEKPNVDRAREYIQSGHFGWNSGMFIFSASGYLRALREFQPEAHAGLTKIAEQWGTANQSRALCEIYPTLPKISVDYAIMEPASTSPQFEVCTVLMQVNWIDVGSWPSFGETLDADAAGNKANCRTLHLDSRGVLAVSDDPHHTIATIGCEDLLIIRTSDATLVVPVSQAQRVKDAANVAPEHLK